MVKSITKNLIFSPKKSYNNKTGSNAPESVVIGLLSAKKRKLLRDRIYYRKNSEKIKNRVKVWQEENKIRRQGYMKEYTKNRKENDVQFKLGRNLRKRIANTLRRNSIKSKLTLVFGCTLSELKKHLESQFKNGMTWRNWGREGWHIDHIKPISSFNLEDKEEFLKAVHYTNLQPLWAFENMSKHAKIL